MNRKTNKMEELKEKGYLLYEAENERNVAVVSEKSGLRLANENPRLKVIQCESYELGLALMGIALESRGGKLDLSDPCVTTLSNMSTRLIVEYRLHRDEPPYACLSFLDGEFFDKGSPIDKLVRRLSGNAKCIVWCNNYVVYTTKVIPLAEIQSADTFIRNIESPAFRNQHSIFLIAETYALFPTVDSYGVRFFDISNVYQEPI